MLTFGDRWIRGPVLSPATVPAPDPRRRDSMTSDTRRVVVGIGGARQNAAVALCIDGELRAFCEQERMTRVRKARLSPSLLPVEAFQAVLDAGGGLKPSEIRYTTAEEAVELPVATPVIRVDHHRAHAATAFYLSKFDTAAILVCDQHDRVQTSVWVGTPDGLVRQERPVSGQGLATLYSGAAELFGFSRGSEHLLESLARLDPGGDSIRLEGVIGWIDGVLEVSPDWRTILAGWLTEADSASLGHRARVAGAFQRHMGMLLLRLVSDIKTATGATRLCLGGGLFYNTWFNTAVREAGVFDDVFVPPNPGNAGAVIGAALCAAEEDGHRSRAAVSPFLGPEYDLEEIKRTLDNCKLSGDCLSEREVIDVAADALGRGLLVGWFQGRMEWGHRALGNRSILANPLSPYALDNLNVFLKHRERHRAYGVSVLEERAAQFFAGPPTSRFMEYEYRPVNRDLFKAVMPEGTSAIRVQTVPDRPSDSSTARFRRLHEAFEKVSGVPVLINTSFNGFAEPIVCSPRDAIRVFYGTGLDLLVMDRFVIRK